MKLSEELSPNPTDSELVGAIRASHSWIISQRHLVCLAAFETQIRIRGHHAVVDHQLEDGNTVPIIAFPLLPEAVDAQTGMGFVRCFISPLHLFTAVTISVGGKLIATMFWSIGEENKDLQNDFLKYELDAQQAAEYQEMAEQAIATANAENGLTELLEGLRRESKNVAEKVYTTTALLFTQDAGLGAMREQFADGGLYVAAKKDLSFVEAISALSLVASINGERGILKGRLEQRGHDLSDIVDRCSGYERSTGMPLIKDFEKFIFTYV